MGPLASTALMEAQRKTERADLAEKEKQRRETIKMLNDEARKERLHNIKIAKELGKAEVDGIPIEKPLARVVQASKRPVAPLARPTNPEAGPTDVVPAMLAPGEAVIPAPAAQNPANKGLIQSLIQQGRQMLDSYRGQPQAAAAPLGGMTGNAAQQLMTRKQRLDAAEKASLGMQRGGVVAPLGFQYGTDGIDLTDEEVAFLESGNDPSAKNPYSSASGLYQMLKGAREDVEARRPELAGSDFKNPSIQKEYRDTYKEILAERLDKYGLNPTDSNINRAWVVGANGLRKIYNSKGDLSLEEVLGKKVTDINPNLQGKTVAQFLTDKNPYSRDQAANEAEKMRATPSQIRQSDLDIENKNKVARIDEALTRIGDNPLPGMAKERERLVQSRNAILGATGQPEAQPINQVPETQTLEVPAPREAPTLPEAGQQIRAEEALTKPPAPDEERPDPTEVKNLIEMTTQSDDMAARWNDVYMTKDQMEKSGQSEKSIQDYLIGAIKSIYGGENSLFSDRDLLKFAVLTAGGLLTGGSVAGSVRYAGRAIFQDIDQREAWANQEKVQERAAVNADKRAAARETAAQKAQDRREKWRIEFDNAKDQRERFQVFENKFYELNKDASPEAREMAIKYYTTALQAKDPQTQQANMRAALTALSSAQVPSGQGTKPEFMILDNGTRAQVYFTPDKKMMVRAMDSTSGEYVEYKGTARTPQDLKQEEDDLRKGVTARIGKLFALKAKTKEDSANLKLKAEGTAEEVLELRSQFLNVNRAQFGSIVENGLWAAEHSGEDINKISSPGGMRKYLYGSALVETRKTDPNGLYSIEGGKRPAPEALAALGDIVTRNTSSKYPRDQVIRDLEQAWLTKVSKEKQKSYADQARGVKGWSPFLLWVYDENK